MVEEIRRNHDARPTEEERRWMEFEPVSAVVGLMVLAGLALAIGVSATSVADTAQQQPPTTASR